VCHSGMELDHFLLINPASLKCRVYVARAAHSALMYPAPSALSYPARPIAAAPYVIPAAVPSSFSPMFSETGMCRV
jgi:hypothetical protein